MFLPSANLSNCRCLRCPLRLGPFGFFLEAERGDLVGVGAVDDFGFVLYAEDDVVEFPLGGEEGVAGGGEGVLGLDGGFVGGAHLVEGVAGGLAGVAGVVRLVVGDGLERRVGVDVGVELLRGDAAGRCAGHDSSGCVGGVKSAATRPEHYARLCRWGNIQAVCGAGGERRRGVKAFAGLRIRSAGVDIEFQGLRIECSRLRILHQAVNIEFHGLRIEC